MGSATKNCMRKMIEPFIKHVIVKEVQDGNMIYFYGADETMLAELYFEEQKISSVTYYTRK
ncbi:hypothetical protein CSE16_11465 [Solibacillus sp. R5-41]|uniref:hypothetical protein n=1 Tax=Solibacillus sp. R5-41 TaxID=2048654 RepID=UPI000C128763|nr:hypothetical protein [Solibacillus sp. R5-41]ATP40618.1 hypothetical protein CSE16_11465 [Solibacillus sp. R5-41]